MLIQYTEIKISSEEHNLGQTDIGTIYANLTWTIYRFKPAPSSLKIICNPMLNTIWESIASTW